MKCGADKNTTCMARQGDLCMEHLMTDTPCCSSRVAITNADRIRGMSDEGLADWMALLKGDTSGGLARFMLKWLRQPVKEEYHEAD